MAALALSAAFASTASSATTVLPSSAEERDFVTTDGGWTSAVDYGDLVCIPGVTCPTATPSYRSSGGLAGAGDGHLRQTFGTLLGVLGTTTITWTSPTFVAPSGTDTATVTMQIRPQIASLLAIGSVSVQTRIVDDADPSQTFVVATTPLTAASASFGSRQLTVDPAKLVGGRSYRIQIATSHTTSVSAVTSGNVDLDSVALTLSDLSPPLNLAGSFTAGAVRGTVETNGSATDVSVEYGPTAAYGSTTTPVTVTGSGSRSFSIPLTGLTLGTSYHYRVVATNADGTVRTADATFVPAAPETSAPLVTGADNSRVRTVTFSRAGDVDAAAVEILDGALNVVDTVLDAGDDGTQAITLPDADGTYGVRVVRTNLSGLSSTSSSVSALLDRVAPSVTGVALGVTPALSSVGSRSVAFVRPNDAATVTAQVIDATGAAVGGPVTLAGTGGVVQLGSADGVYRVRLRVTDAAGNSAETLSDALTLDRVAPAAGPAPTVEGTPDALTVRFARAQDAATAAIEVLDTAGTVLLVVAVPDAGAATLALPAAAGTYGVRAVQADAAGNTSHTAATAVARPAKIAPPQAPPAAPPTAPARLAPNAPTRLAVGAQGDALALPIRCPEGGTCDVSGTLRTTAKAFSGQVFAARASDVVVARFSGLRINAGTVKNAKLRISARFVRRAQRAGLRTVRATLTIRTVRADGSAATTTSRLTLVVPKAKRRPVTRPRFTG